MELLELEPSLRVLVLERSAIPYGASTRNAGIVCFGSLSEILESIKLLGSQSEVEKLAERRIRGSEKLLSLLGREEIVYQACGGYELFRREDAASFSACQKFRDEWNVFLQPLTGKKETFLEADQKISEFGFGQVEHMLWNSCEGAVDTGKLHRALQQKASHLGARILTGVEVLHVDDERGVVAVETKNLGKIHSKKVILATNAFASQYFPERILPARAQVCITAPLQGGVPFHGTFHFAEGYYYFRDLGDRVLFGGGREQDREGETTHEMGLHEGIQKQLHYLLKKHILPGKKFEIDMRWSGIMAVSPRKTGAPIVENISENIFSAVRMATMGLAIGPLVAEEVAKQVISSLQA